MMNISNVRDWSKVRVIQRYEYSKKSGRYSNATKKSELRCKSELNKQKLKEKIKGFDWFFVVSFSLVFFLVVDRYGYDCT